MGGREQKEAKRDVKVRGGREQKEAKMDVKVRAGGGREQKEAERDGLRIFIYYKCRYIQ